MVWALKLKSCELFEGWFHTLYSSTGLADTTCVKTEPKDNLDQDHWEIVMGDIPSATPHSKPWLSSSLA